MNNYGFSDFPNEMRNFEIFGGIFFSIIVGMILFVIISAIKTWSSNNAAEIITKYAKVVSRRIHVWGGSGDSSANTSYYITFEFEDDSRKEFQINSQKYGLIIEGDQGHITFQGTRFVEFKRAVDQNSLGL